MGNKFSDNFLCDVKCIINKTCLQISSTNAYFIDMLVCFAIKGTWQEYVIEVIYTRVFLWAELCRAALLSTLNEMKNTCILFCNSIQHLVPPAGHIFHLSNTLFYDETLQKTNDPIPIKSAVDIRGMQKINHYHFG